MIMRQIIVLFFLLEISVGLNLLHKKLNSYFEKSELNYELTSCIKIAMKKLFNDDKQINVVAPEGFMHLRQTEMILKELEEHITIRNFWIYNDTIRYKNPLEKILTAFLVFSTDQVQFQTNFNGDFFKDFAKFIILTNDTTDSLHNFTRELIQNGFKRVAFLQIHSDLTYPEDKYNYSNIAHCPQVLKDPESIKFIKPNHSPVLQFVKIINDDFVPNNESEHKRRKKNVSFAARLLSPIADKFSIKLKQHTKTWEWNMTLDLMKHNMVNIIYAPDQQNILKHLSKLDVLGPVEFDSVYVIDRVRPASMKYFTFAKIFTTRVWYCTISAFIAVILLSLCLNKFQPGGTKREFLHFRDIFMMTLSQGIPHVPTRTSFRFGVGMWIFFVYIMTIVFNDNYRSTITGLPRIKLLKTFEDAIESGRVVYGSEYYVNLLRNSTDRRMADFGRRCQIAPSQHTLNKVLYSDGLGLLRQSDVLGHNYINRAIVSHQLYFLTSTEIFVSYSLLFTKRYDYFNEAYGEVLGVKRAMGILNKIRTDYNKEKYGAGNVRLMDVPKQSSSIKLLHLTRVLKYIYLGYLIAIIVYICEIIFNRIKG